MQAAEAIEVTVQQEVQAGQPVRAILMDRTAMPVPMAAEAEVVTVVMEATWGKMAPIQWEVLYSMVQIVSLIYRMLPSVTAIQIYLQHQMSIPVATAVTAATEATAQMTHPAAVVVSAAAAAPAEAAEAAVEVAAITTHRTVRVAVMPVRGAAPSWAMAEPITMSPTV